MADRWLLAGRRQTPEVKALLDAGAEVDAQDKVRRGGVTVVEPLQQVDG